MGRERLVLPAAEERSLTNGTRPRVAVAFAGDPDDPKAWSGLPYSLGRSLERLGVEVVPLVALPGRRAWHAAEAPLTAFHLPRAMLRSDHPRTAVSLARALAQHSPAMAAVRSRAARRAFARLGAVDAVIQIGSDFSLPAGVRYVTWEDMTIAQVRAPEAHGTYPPWEQVTERAAARLRRRQSALYADAVACVTATHWAASSIVSDYGIAPERVVVVGFGAQVRVEPRERPWSPPRFLFVGMDWERKNGPAVLRAFAEVRRSAPAARLDVVGGHPPLDVEGVTGHGVLHWADEREAAHLAGLFEAATCFVMPSLYEAAGVVYVEAGAAGVPSIGTTHGGAATMIGPGGKLVDPTDEAALTRAMLELSDAATASRLGALALPHARRFTWDQVGQRTLRALALPGVDTTGFAEYL